MYDNHYNEDNSFISSGLGRIAKELLNDTYTDGLYMGDLEYLYNSLSPKQRFILDLKIDGLEDGAIATRLKIKESAIKMQISRIKKRFLSNLI